jgi:dTDP-4-dehydrorhamnose reductase
MGHRVLVVGPSSGLAEEFVQSAPQGWSFEGVGRTAARFTADRYDVAHLVDAQEIGLLEYAVRANDCDTVVSFLQEGDRLLCQSERPLPGAVPAGVAWEVNVLATEAVGRAAVSEHKRVVVISTDEVFAEAAGPVEESADPVPWPENPSWYGATWAEAETLLGRLAGSVAILRVSALFGWSLGPACDRRLAAALDYVNPEAPETFQPTFVPDAARAIRRLVEDPVEGRFHVALSQSISRDVLGSALKAALGLVPYPQEPVPERHPGLVPGRLFDLGVSPTSASEALASIGKTGPA